MFGRVFRKNKHKKELSKHRFHSSEYSFDYDLVQTNRRSISIQIERDAKVIVRANFQTTPSKIEEILRIKQSWIGEKRREILSLQMPINSESLYDYYPIKGELLPLMEHESSTVRVIPSEAILIPSNLSVSERSEFLNRMIRKGSQNEFEPLFWLEYERACVINPLLQKFPVELRFRKMTRAWGNCRANRITLNTALYHYPIHLCRYVICHEIAHLIHKNHGREFYALQEALFPEWRQAKKELNERSISYAPLLYSSQPKVV